MHVSNANAKHQPGGRLGNMRVKNFIIPLVIYPFDVMVSLGETDEELKKAFKKHKQFEHEDYFKHEMKYGRSSLLPNGNTVIRMKFYPANDYGFGSLAHEIFHTVMKVFDIVGIKWCDESDEAYAYCISYLTTEIYKRLK